MNIERTMSRSIQEHWIQGSQNQAHRQAIGLIREMPHTGCKETHRRTTDSHRGNRNKTGVKSSACPKVLDHDQIRHAICASKEETPTQCTGGTNVLTNTSRPLDKAPPAITRTTVELQTTYKYEHRNTPVKETEQESVHSVVDSKEAQMPPDRTTEGQTRSGQEVILFPEQGKLCKGYPSSKEEEF